MKTIYMVMPGMSFNPDANILKLTTSLPQALEVWNEDKGGRSIFSTQLDLAATFKVDICAACGQVVENGDEENK